MATPTKVTYENALKIVESYENRQAELKQLEKDLSFKLKQFSQVKFKIDKKNKEVLFAGLHKETRKIFIGQSKCNSGDKYEPVIGKLIAVKKALHEDVKDVEKLLESCLALQFPTGTKIYYDGSWAIDNASTCTTINN